jgi:hypothetical protein
MNGFNCDEVGERLDDYVDGLLDVGERAALSFHLDACSSCRQEERSLRDLLDKAKALALEVAPPRDLWPGIERGIRSRARPGVWLRGLAAAACVVLALAGAWLTRAPGPMPPAASTAAVALPVAQEQAAIQKLEGDYEAAAAALLAQLRARRSQLPPETVAQVEASLRTIDGALAEIRTALQQEPSQPGLHLMLAATHRKKVDVLRRVMELGA